MSVRWSIVLTALGAASAAAQVPGAPVLQNAFHNPGLAFAANFGSGTGQSFFGAAAAYGLGGRFQVTGAAGGQRSNGSSRGAYGIRAAAALWSSSSGSLGAGAFAGVGGAPSTRVNGVTTNTAVTSVPAGLTIGYRRPMGTTRGLSLYASPLYRWTRSDSAGTIVSNGSMRGAVGLDFAFTSSLGITLGGEFGGKTETTGTGLFGAAVSFVPGRR